MSGPKHLWSGDWERESARVAQDRGELPVPDHGAPPDEAQPAADQDAHGVRWWWTRHAAIGLGAGLAAAALTIALMTTLGGASPAPHHGRRHNGSASHARPRAHSHSTVPGQSTTPPQTRTQSTTQTVNGPTATWLGMQIVTDQAGVVIATIKLGSWGDAAGLEPGDQITSIDSHPISSIRQIGTDTARLRIGSPVTIGALRSSTVVVSSTIPLVQRPKITP